MSTVYLCAPISPSIDQGVQLILLSDLINLRLFEISPVISHPAITLHYMFTFHVIHELNLSWELYIFREAFNKKRIKKCKTLYIGVGCIFGLMYLFSETRPISGNFLKKNVFCPLEMSNTCKNVLNPIICEHWPIFTQKIFFYQNGSEWPKMHFKHNFLKCKILSALPPLWNILHFF